MLTKLQCSHPKTPYASSTPLLRLVHVLLKVQFSQDDPLHPNRAEDNDTQKDSLTTLEKKVEETDDVAEYRRALSEFNEQQELSDNASKLVEAYKDKIK